MLQAVPVGLPPTATGTLLLLVAPLPSRPEAPLPQHQAVPSVRMPHRCSVPPATLDQVALVPLTAVGEETVVVVDPIPACPASSAPQQNSWAAELIAQKVLLLAATELQEPDPTRTGADRLGEPPVPNWP